MSSKSKPRNIIGKEFVIGIVLLALAVTDGFFTYDLFIGENLSPQIAVILAILVGISLEGLPSLFAMYLSRVLDKALIDATDKNKAKFGMWISLIASIAVLGFIIYMRYNVIINHGGFESFEQSTISGGTEFGFYEGFIADVIIMVFTFFTSVIAFMLSFMSMESNIKKLETEMKNKETKLSSCKETRDDLYAKLIGKINKVKGDLKIVELDLTELNDPDSVGKLTSLNTTAGFMEFMQKSRENINNSICDEIISFYPDQWQNFTGQLTQELDIYRLELSNLSKNFKNAIGAIDIEKDVLPLKPEWENSAEKLEIPNLKKLVETALNSAEESEK